MRSKAECTREEANGAVRTLLDILLQSTFCQASQVRCAHVECAPEHRAVPCLPETITPQVSTQVGVHVCMRQNLLSLHWPRRVKLWVLMRACHHSHSSGHYAP